MGITIKNIPGAVRITGEGLWVAIAQSSQGSFLAQLLGSAAHHRIPLLSVMHNNRAYHQEVMEVQRQCALRNRGIDRAKIGTAMDDPCIDFAKFAEGMGLYAEGPITDPKDLGPALRRAVAVVKRGEPTLVDGVTRPR